VVVAEMVSCALRVRESGTPHKGDKMSRLISYIGKKKIFTVTSGTALPGKACSSTLGSIDIQQESGKSNLVNGHVITMVQCTGQFLQPQCLLLFSLPLGLLQHFVHLQKTENKHTVSQVSAICLIAISYNTLLFTLQHMMKL
jgi:hypothetical protein